MVLKVEQIANKNKKNCISIFLGTSIMYEGKLALDTIILNLIYNYT